MNNNLLEMIEALVAHVNAAHTSKSASWAEANWKAADVALKKVQSKVKEDEEKFLQTHNWLCDRNETIAEQAAEIERMKQSEVVMKSYYEQVFADGGKRIADLKQQVSAAQNSDEHNFNRWQAAQADNEQLLKALEAYEQAFDGIFSHCLSNGVFNAWQKRLDCTVLNNAHYQAEQAIRTHKARKEQV